MRGCYYNEFNIGTYCDEWIRERDEYIRTLVERGVESDRIRQLVARFVRLTLRSD